MLEVVLGRDVGGDRDRGARAIFRIDPGGDRVAGVLFAARYHDLRAMLGHRLRDRPADAARRSGYQRDLALHVEQVHAPAIFAKSHDRSASGSTRSDIAFACAYEAVRSDERRVGKEGVSKCRYRWATYH